MNSWFDQSNLNNNNNNLRPATTTATYQHQHSVNSADSTSEVASSDNNNSSTNTSSNHYYSSNDTNNSSIMAAAANNAAPNYQYHRQSSLDNFLAGMGHYNEFDPLPLEVHHHQGLQLSSSGGNNNRSQPSQNNMSNTPSQALNGTNCSSSSNLENNPNSDDIATNLARLINEEARELFASCNTSAIGLYNASSLLQQHQQHQNQAASSLQPSAILSNAALAMQQQQQVQHQAQVQVVAPPSSVVNIPSGTTSAASVPPTGYNPVDDQNQLTHQFMMWNQQLAQISQPNNSGAGLLQQGNTNTISVSALQGNDSVALTGSGAFNQGGTNNNISVLSGAFINQANISISSISGVPTTLNNITLLNNDNNNQHNQHNQHGQLHHKPTRPTCSFPTCTNRIVQGGRCISHGARRKTCSHPSGCTKHVKKAGRCSAHGPARKRCEYEGCTKVAVQGGRCVGHGAKKRFCSHGEGCVKLGILGGMCKKHYDAVHGRHTKGHSAPRKNNGNVAPSSSLSSQSSTSPLVNQQQYNECSM